jgi:hypothetical protein
MPPIIPLAPEALWFMMEVNTRLVLSFPTKVLRMFFENSFIGHSLT